MEFFSQPASWTLVAFIIFVAIAIYLKAPSMIGKLLDEQIERVKKELSDAIELKEEANALLAEYERKKEDAEKEAEIIIANAKERAKNYEQSALSKSEEIIKRQEAQSVEKINQAEIQAMSRIRKSIIEKSIDSAEKLVSEKISSKKSDQIFTDSLKDLDKLKI
ncbi:MAG: ATP F0F1 synthase subunit B [Pelagibacterales bacterium]|nr:ATP F0F1 synthase subunit B [Pelagibacterales bacterium]MBL6861535.1 ATP F0F1 synthase subunit B [Pelagibacterales bacterium]